MSDHPSSATNSSGPMTRREIAARLRALSKFPSPEKLGADLDVAWRQACRQAADYFDALERLGIEHATPFAPSENALTACSGVDCERCEAFERRAIAALELLRRWRDEARGRDLYDKTTELLNVAPQASSECRRLTYRLEKIDAVLDQLGAPKSDDWDGIHAELSQVGRILRLTGFRRDEDGSLVRFAPSATNAAQQEGQSLDASRDVVARGQAEPAAAAPSAPSAEGRTGSLLAEYRRRAADVDEACERSNAMERDFLEKKVLNADANEALKAYGRKRARFGEWLLQVSDDLVADVMADAVNEIADAAAEAFRAADITPGEWDGDNIVQDVKHGIVGCIEILYNRSAPSSAPLTGETPITDELCRRLQGNPPVSFTESDAEELATHARQLERELAEARSDFDIMKRSRDHEHRERLALSATERKMLEKAKDVFCFIANHGGDTYGTPENMCAEDYGVLADCAKAAGEQCNTIHNYLNPLR